MNWGVNAYVEWHKVRLESAYEEVVDRADLMKLGKLVKKDLEGAMCYFVPEVTRAKGEGLYPGKTLYEMCVLIQKYLNVNKLNWKLVEGDEFRDLRVVLGQCYARKSSTQYWNGTQTSTVH